MSKAEEFKKLVQSIKSRVAYESPKRRKQIRNNEIDLVLEALAMAIESEENRLAKVDDQGHVSANARAGEARREAREQARRERGEGTL